MNKPRLNRLAAGAVAAAVLLASGCAAMSAREQGTAQGAGVGAVGAVAGNIWSKRQEDRRIALEQATQGTGVEVSCTADNQLKLNIPNDVSFDLNSAAIRPAMHSVLDPSAGQLQGDPNARISIVGHTDSSGSDAVNDPLSVQRAQSVRDDLVTRGAVPEHVQTAGRGEREPVADNATEAGRARNRRVEIFLREQAG